LARQSRATRKGARGSWGNQNKTITRQNTIKKLKNIIICTTFAYNQVTHPTTTSQKVQARIYLPWQQ
jgi:hypothetical protein